ncbi:hypothetical protein Tco_0712215 [Tanacetum coccineum]
MVVQNQAKLGEGSAILTDPHHTPTIIQPSTSQPKKTQKPRKPKRKDTQVPQPSGPTKHVEDEAVHKELGDSLVRAATTASSLEAEQDNGNITKTRSKATPNESSSLGTTSSGNTLRSDEDSLKLKELMELCTNLQQRVLDLEKTKTTQQNEIASLKRRGRILCDEESLGEDASKQGRRINAIDADEDITLVNDDADKEMFDVDTLNGKEVFVARQNENVVEEVVNAAQVSTAATTITITTEEITLAQALEVLKTSKPKDKGKGIMIEEPVKPLKKKDLIRLDEEIASKLQDEFDEDERLAREKDEANVALTKEWDDLQAKIEADHELAQRLQAEEQEELSDVEKATLFQQLLEKRRKRWKHKDLKSKDFDSIKELFDKAFTRVNMFVDFKTKLVEGSSKRAGEELEQESTKKQKVDEDKDTIELQSLMEVIPDEEEVAIDAVPLATKSPSIVDWKIHKKGNKSYYQIVRADGKSQMYRVFSQMLKSFTMEDLEDLYKLVKAKYGSTRPVEDLNLVLWNDLKTMFEPHVEDEIWKLQQRYPLTPPTITDLLNKKLQVDYFSEMAYQLLKLLTKQLKNQ